MKKYMLTLITIFLLGISQVQALDIIVDSIEIKEKSDNIAVENPSLNGTTIDSNIEFREVGDYVTYEVKFRGNDTSTYKLDSVEDDNKNEFIKTTYKYSETLESPLYITLSYDKEVSGELDLKDINIVLNTVDENGNKSSIIINDNIINPNTGIALSVGLSLLAVGIVFFMYYRYYKKKNISTMIIVLGLLLIPASIVFAESKNISLVLKTDNISVFKGLAYVTEPQVPGEITVGDELAVDTEHFYVISSNEEKTVLLAKYNLYVGSIFNADFNNNKLEYIGEISKIEEGYGLQNENARAGIMDSSNWIGSVPFSGRNYWVDENYNLLSKYGTQELNDSWKNNNIYDALYNEPMPELSFNDDFTAYISKENYNDYSVALYVEEYIKKLQDKGLTNVNGRLMTYEEATNLGCYSSNFSCRNSFKWIYFTTYWLGTADSYCSVWYIRSDGGFDYDFDFYEDVSIGVRPVIVVPTSDIDI